MSLAEIKRLARSEATLTRIDVHEMAKLGAGAALAARGLPVARNDLAKVISAFHSFDTEISTFELFDKLVADGWITALPVVVAKNTPLVFRQWAPGDALVLGRWNIKVPPEEAPEVLPDVLLVPLLAFDRKGFRLGYGGGFYDRTLEKLRALKNVTAIGIAYAGQEVDAVPHEDFDQRLDWIMTEKETIKCG
ncbi:MAG TPA: 5-formyltetrahydrofolate cyclo-ligase [Aestuariivirga sp.]|nr:5-formyltetrahydrofolate cyclo-ligase [Aestuariivirga sp.]